MLSAPNKKYCEQLPVVPWQLIAACDYSWFVLLGMVTLFLPPSYSIRADYKLVRLQLVTSSTRQNPPTRKATKLLTLCLVLFPIQVTLDASTFPLQLTRDPRDACFCPVVH